MSNSQRVVHQAGWYAAAYTATQLVTVVAAILTRRFLGPLQVGVWALIQVILSYVAYSPMGVGEALVREIPFYVGKGDSEKTTRIKRVSFEFIMLMAFLIGAGIGAYALIMRSRISRELFWGLLFASALVILQQLNNVTITLLRAFKKFDLAGKQMFLSAIVNALLVAVLSYRFRLFGFMSAMCFSFLFNIIYIFHYEKNLFLFKWDFKLDVQQIRGLMVYGFPLMLVSLLGTFIQTLDRLFISKYLGLEMLGIYSIATMVTGFVFSFPNSVGTALLTDVFEKFGKTEDPVALRKYLEESDQGFCVFMPALIGMTWFLAPPLIQWVLPKFASGIPSLKYLVLSAFFMAISQAYGNFLVVIRKQLWLFPVGVLTLLVAVGLNFWVMRRGGRIEDVAIVQAIVFGVNFIMIFFLSHFYLKTIGPAFMQFVKILAKFGGMLFLLIFIPVIICPPNPLVRGIFQTFLLMAVYSPFFLQLEKKYHLTAIFLNRLDRTKPSST